MTRDRVRIKNKEKCLRELEKERVKKVYVRERER